MSQNGPTYIIWNLTKNGSLLPKITHICGKETKFQNRIDTPAHNTQYPPWPEAGPEDSAAERVGGGLNPAASCAGSTGSSNPSRTSCT